MALVCAPALAQPPLERSPTGWQLRQWTMEHGLPQNWIEAVAQPPDGMLWVATSTGLARLEGEAFVRVDASVEGGSPLANVKRLFSDPEGRLWAETFSEAFYSDDGQEFRRAPESPSAQPPRGSTGFLLDPEGFIHRLTPEGSVLLRTESAAPARGHRRVVVQGQVLYTGADQGIRRYALQGSGSEVRELPRIPTASPVVDLLADHQGGLWVGLSDGVFRREDDRWIRILEGLSNPEFFEDLEGSLWIGTNGEGLWQILPSATFEIDLEGLPDPVVWTAAISPGGELWVGTEKGLARLTDEGFQTVSATLGLTVHSLAFDTSNTLWVGCPRGLFRLRLGEPGLEVLEPVPLPLTEVGPQPPIRGAMEPTPAGDLWIGTSQGLFHLVIGAVDGRVENVRQVTGPGTARPSPQRIRDLELDAMGRLWIVGESEGLWRLESDRLTQTALEGLDSETIGLWFAPDGAPWVTTRSRGVLRVDGEQWVAVTREHGLFDDNVHQMLPDGLGWVWMTSNRGVFKVRFDDLQGVADGHSRHLEAVSYGTEDGLLNVECNSGHPGAILLPDGHLMVPTMDGLARADPARPRHNSVPPKLTITAMQANYRPVDLRGPLRLGPNQRNISIDYAASTYVMPSKTRYRYRLESVDDTWIDAGARRTAFYTDLEPGRYTFRVHAANADGVWSLDEATLLFEVLPLWHERGDVRTFLGILVGALLAGLGWILGRRFQLRDSRRRPEAVDPKETIDPPARSVALDGPSALDGSDEPAVTSPEYPLVNADSVDVESLDEAFLRRVSEAIEARLDDSDFGVFELAEAVHLSRRQLHRKLVAMVGENPATLLRRIRLERAQKLLLGGAGSVAEVARAVGYTKPGHFSERFKQAYGMNPSELLQGSKDPHRDTKALK